MMTKICERALPAGFEDLQPFVAKWAKATEAERHAVRENSTIAEADAFYAAMLPRMEEILGWLAGQPAHGLDAEAATLLDLANGLVEASLATEVYRQPEVINGFDRSRLHFV